MGPDSQTVRGSDLRNIRFTLKGDGISQPWGRKVLTFGLFVLASVLGQPQARAWRFWENKPVENSSVIKARDLRLKNLSKSLKREFGDVTVELRNTDLELSVEHYPGKVSYKVYHSSKIPGLGTVRLIYAGGEARSGHLIVDESRLTFQGVRPGAFVTRGAFEWGNGERIHFDQGEQFQADIFTGSFDLTVSPEGQFFGILDGRKVYSMEYGSSLQGLSKQLQFTPRQARWAKVAGKNFELEDTGRKIWGAFSQGELHFDQGFVLVKDGSEGTPRL